MKKQNKQFVAGFVLSLLLLFVGSVHVVAPSDTYKDGTVANKDKLLVASKSQSQEMPVASEPNKTVVDQRSSEQPFKRVNTAVSRTADKEYTMLGTPNDPYYSPSGYLQTIRAQGAWDTTEGSDEVTVAVLDSGFALEHEDLVGSYATNIFETGTTQVGDRCWTGVEDDKRNNQCDDDGNGYVDDYRGWDFFGNDNSPQAGEIDPSGNGVAHGTQVAGLVGARGNNGIGATAVSWNVSVLPLQVLSDTGNGYSTDIANAVYYAVDSGADVINMSLGTSGDDPQVRLAVDYAVDNNVVIVAAAGNCGNNSVGICAGQVAGYVAFPASYSRVIAVGATDNNGVRASFSSYGQRVDIVAPGSGPIVSPTWQAQNENNGYSDNLYGTSFSSPITASAVALLRSIRPSSTVDDVRALLLGNARKLQGMNQAFYTKYYGHGQLDVSQLIAIATQLNAQPEQAPVLLQAGTNKSEHSFTSSSTIGSGCEAPAQRYCTVWLKNSSDTYERYLPYQKTSNSGITGWLWSASAMEQGEWQVRARSGNAVSNTPYFFFKK